MPNDIKTMERDAPVNKALKEEIIEELVDAEYVAAKLGVSKAFIYKLVREGQLEAIHVGRLVRFAPESLRRLCNQRSRKNQ